MATEIDPVVLVLEARLDKYEAGLRNAVRTSDQSFGRIDRDVRRLEQQFSRSSAAIGGSLRGLAGTFAAAFTTQQVTGLIDSYTRLQNSLKVAGVEGENLAQVQSRLLDLSGRYGVNIEELARLFGNSSQAASELGANQDQLLTLTEATAQALKITGTSAAQAQGAILGLTQALASGTVRAEEFNQINEGGLRPLLQLVANTERYGGSVAQLRNAVVEGKVSSQEFYQAILAGSEVLGGQASKATLTIAGAFESLNSQLTVYVGQASETSGASQALAAGIQALADNLDVVIPAVAVLSTALGVGFVTNLTRTAIAAQGAGTALLGAFGGPVGLAITAIAVALGYVATEAAKTQAETERLAKSYDDLRSRVEAAAQRAGQAADGIKQGGDAARIANPLVIGIGMAYKFAADQAALLAKNAKLATLAEIDRERTANKRQIAKLQEDQRISRRADQAVTVLAPVADFITGEGDRRARRQADRADTIRSLQNRVRDLDALAAQAAALPESAFEQPTSPKPVVTGGKDKDKKNRTKTGPTATEITERFNSQLIALTQQTLSAQSSLAKNADERAELELRSVELARIQTESEIKNTTEFSKARKQRLLNQLEVLADFERERVERDRLAQIEQEERELAEERFRAGQDDLQNQLDLAVTQAERRAISLQLLDLDFRYREALLQSIIASETVADAEKERARIALEALRANQGARVENARRGTETPGQRFIREVGESGQRINEDFEAVAVDGLQSLNDGLVDAIVNAKSLGQVFSGVAKQIVADLLRIAIQQAVIRPLAESLFGGGGGGGGLGGILSFASLFAGRASGGPVSAGRLYRVNEAAGAGGVELFQPAQNGNIVPLGQTRAAMGGGQQSISGTITISLSEDIDGRIVSVAGPLSVQIVREASGPLIEASANEALRRAGRPKL